MIKRVLLSSLLFLVSFVSISAEEVWNLMIPVQAYTVRINPQNANRIIIGNYSNQIYNSYDGGKTWDIIEIGSRFSGNYLTSLYYCSADTSVILAGGAVLNGIKRTSDGGETWEQVLQDTNFRRMWFISEAIIEDPQNPSTIYAGRGSTYNTVYKSTDVGATWDSISVVDHNITGRICTISIHPDSSNVLFLGCKGGIVMRSDDSGITWAQMKVLGRDLIQPDSEIPKFVYSQLDPKVAYAVVAIAVEDDIVDNGGVLKTSDGGFTWDRIAFTDTSLWAIEVKTSADGLRDELYVGGFRISNTPTSIQGDSLVFHSPDGGETWTRYKGIKWQENEVGDTIRNVWSIRADTVGDRIFMATVLGLYELVDPNTSVETEDPRSPETMRASVTSNGLIVRDLEPRTEDNQWALYSMQGAMVLNGAILTPEEQVIPLSSIPPGQYLLTWGSQKSIRTVLFSLVR